LTIDRTDAMLVGCWVRALVTAQTTVSKRQMFKVFVRLISLVAPSHKKASILLHDMNDEAFPTIQVLECSLKLTSIQVPGCVNPLTVIQRYAEKT
jgi:hypothetical protein